MVKERLQILEEDSQKVRTKSQKPIKAKTQNISIISLPAEPILESGDRETVLKKIIPGIDGRIQIAQTDQWPHSVHGVVAIHFPKMGIDKNAWGTGTLIGPNLVLTAAHNLYSHEYKEEVDSVRFLPAINGKLLPFSEPKVIRFYFPKKYKIDNQEDYGLLVLDQPIAEITGHFGINILSKDQLNGKTINVTGYPGDKVKDKNYEYEMWGMEGKPVNIDNDHIGYEIDTFGGQSGSAVWYQEGESYYVVGVHITGTKDITLGLNKATLLNRARYDQIRTWIESSIYERIQKGTYDDVQEVNFYEFSIGDFGSQQLSKYVLTSLQTLNLGWNKIGIEGAKALSQTSWPQLKKLNLEWNVVGDNGAKVLSQGLWSCLESLNLQSNGITDDGLKILSGAPWHQLKILNLRDNAIRREGCQALSESHWSRLRTLNLGGNKIGIEGAKALSRAHWPYLEVLGLGSNQIGSDGLKALSQAPWTQLQVLYLDKNSIEDDGIEVLSQAPWPQLQTLGLSQNSIGDNGAKVLSRLPWVHLRVLNLSWNKIGVDGVQEFFEASYRPQLQILDLMNNSISSQEAEEIKKKESHFKL
ncbi:MAG: trypsin-like peptidase domain-containing protein [Caedimonas sp.]|nr:trypsin-like peptidase domain-containing protein [Caedimonas sp.]